MSIREEARRVAARAEAEYLVIAAERVEGENGDLRSIIAAVVIANNGPIRLTRQLLDACSDLPLILRADEDSLTVDIGDVQEETLFDVPQEPLPPPVVLAPQQGQLAGDIDRPETLSEPLDLLEAAARQEYVRDDSDDSDVEVIDDTTETRAERYIARHQQPRVHQGIVKPHIRPWDKPEDLEFQEVAQGRVEHAVPGPNGEVPDWYDERGKELQAGDGSISTKMI